MYMCLQKTSDLGVRISEVLMPVDETTASPSAVELSSRVVRNLQQLHVYQLGRYEVL